MEIYFKNNIDDYKSFYKSLYINDFKSKLTTNISFVVLSGISQATFPFQPIRFIVVVIISELFVIGVGLIIPYFFSINKIKNIAKKNANILEETKLKIIDNGLYFEKKTKSGIRIWESFTTIENNNSYIWIFFNNKEFFLISKNVFLSNHEANDFIGIVQSKINQIKDKKRNLSKKKSNKLPYYVGLVCFIPLIGVLFGLVFIILGFTKYKDKWIVLIGILGILFTIYIYSSL